MQTSNVELALINCRIEELHNILNMPWKETAWKSAPDGKS